MNIYTTRWKTCCAVLAFFLVAPSVMADQAEPPIGMDVGQMYPDFLLPDVDGKLGWLSDFRGRKVLLIHFASW